jgi:hypothetical protein
MRNSSDDSPNSVACGAAPAPIPSLNLPLGIIASPGNSKSCLDASGERVEVADALDFVIREFDPKMIFEAREQFERLQAVNAEFLVEIIARLKFGAWKLKVSGGKIQNFVRRLFECFHGSFYFTGSLPSPAHECGLHLSKNRCCWARISPAAMMHFLVPLQLRDFPATSESRTAHLRQIRMRPCVFHELAQALHDGGARE